MIAPLAKFIDWSALQMAYAVVGSRRSALEFRACRATEGLGNPPVKMNEILKLTAIYAPRSREALSPRVVPGDHGFPIHSRVRNCGRPHEYEKDKHK
jgi:hypothetical protein